MKPSTPANPKLQNIIWMLDSRTQNDFNKGLILEIIAWVLFAFSVCLCGLSILIIQGIYHDTVQLGLASVLFLGYMISVASISAFAVGRIRREARGYRSDPRTDLLHDPRDPVLYLRSFSDDYEENTQPLKWRTHEEVLTKILSDIGPAIALRGPRQPSNLMGAARIKFEEVDWQAGVRYLMSISSFVVIQADISSGLLWELGAVRQFVKPERLLVSFMAWQDVDEIARQKLYLRFKRHIEKIFHIQMPEEDHNARFMVFRADWSPEFIEGNKPKRVIDFIWPMRAHRKLLRPILKERGFGLRSAQADEGANRQILAPVLFDNISIPLAFGRFQAVSIMEVTIRALMLDEDTKQPIMVLKTVDGDELLQVWIGAYEANAIATEIEKIFPEAPMTHDLLRTVISELGAQVMRVVITEIRGNIFYAVVELLQNDKLISVESRPSDAVALAVRVGCPIFVRENLFREVNLHSGSKFEQ